MLKFQLKGFTPLTVSRLILIIETCSFFRWTRNEPGYKLFREILKILVSVSGNLHICFEQILMAIDLNCGSKTLNFLYLGC